MLVVVIYNDKENVRWHRFSKIKADCPWAFGATAEVD